ncbi:F-box/kelch-repeat protein SKIP6 [Rhodamnia argentea]|uniref:F-box/kelch-repeat protein SKIP6 n=1 Tax=Rhodamnia argentea TaxID=178133 RepID=A0A8B8PJJ2_9MYRT|nr:F-box/kelch-repeat protein SKIP6 [Rhodamnia argentea]XP_030534967.1 F-box/kelch-repeat protein SKIP6 [Rhodamnia argentea]XP_048128270.1 F-box/kelch-repeat protein SKIP6 [Rhodamnia argentea]XP_048128271.1 F-box/kelch-repeat protein SKIP6 [Rhodamnia argentea]XP_048128272.1 F-box/kelch-repeat protein SKIP6 [Rhodamnia argentea]XP_048128273.1 F-box/kelch-repeat protein SKIP6 [Rhodamnia argentea]
MSTAPSAAPAAATPLIPSLPDDVAVNIIARVPRSHHPTLSLVSKAFHSLLSSPLLFSARRLLGCTEPSLYLALRHPSSPSHLWFTLYSNANPNPAAPKQHRLFPIAPIPSPSVGSTFAALGPLIYVLGGSVNDVASPCVWVLDCRFHRWKPGPAMRVGREFAASGVVGEKVYVLGGCTVDSWSRANHWAEVLDPGARTWAAVPSSSVEVREKWMHASAVVDERIYAMADRGGIVYDVDKEVWESVESELDMGWRGRACVIDGVLYCYDYLGKIRGFDVKEGVWKELKGVEKGLPKFLCGATMGNLSGNLVVVWEGKGGGKEMEVWCAEIAVKKDEHGELVGCICWSDSILKVSNGSSIVSCLAVAL